MECVPVPFAWGAARRSDGTYGLLSLRLYLNGHHVHCPIPAPRKDGIERKKRSFLPFDPILRGAGRSASECVFPDLRYAPVFAVRCAGVCVCECCTPVSAMKGHCPRRASPGPVFQLNPPQGLCWRRRLISRTEFPPGKANKVAGAVPVPVPIPVPVRPVIVAVW